MMPVRICTEATCEIAILSSVVPNIRGLTRLTWSGLTTIRVGKIRLPRVQRLALKVSPTEEMFAADGVLIAVAPDGNDTLFIIANCFSYWRSSLRLAGSIGTPHERRSKLRLYKGL